jgi:hypothetical protein
MTPNEEAARINALVREEAARAVAIVEAQLNVLHVRAQVLLSLAGVVITVTGFSGRLIAGTSAVAQGFLVSGLAVVLASAIWVFTRVMHIHWVTLDLTDDFARSLEMMIQRRNRKTRAYALGGIILCAGLILYCVSISLMLLNPEPLNLPTR